jgi:probable rRNA maturation factor
MVLNQQKKIRVAIAPLEEFLQRVKSEVRVAGAEVTVCLVSDVQIARMNQQFRKKHGPTDVLSFPAEERLRRVGADGARVLGDIAIAPATARRYAVKNRRKLQDELRILILHGVLHLQGYDHETDHGEMDRIEKKLRRRLGLS